MKKIDFFYGKSLLSKWVKNLDLPKLEDNPIAETKLIL